MPHLSNIRFTLPAKSKLLGFSLIEALVALTIVGILTAMTLPTFVQVIQTNKVNTSSADLFVSLRQMRQFAINQSVSIVVCASHNQKNCEGEALNKRDWSLGWIAFVDLNYNRQRDNQQETLLLARQAYQYIKLHFNRGRRLKFYYNGEINQAGSFFICDKQKVVTNSAIIFNRVGRGYRSDFTSQGKKLTCE